MQRKIHILSLSLVLCFLSACIKKPKDDSQQVFIGTLSVDLDASETLIRTQESLIGNFIADAILAGLETNGMPVDLVLTNAGSIRFDIQKRPDGIYRKGSFTSEMVDEMLPFSENKIVVMQVSGLQLKEILERSLAQLPLEKGSFLQLSKGLKLTADLSKQAQILDETVNPPVIQTAGQRIISLQLNETPIQDNQMYKVAVADYIANGNDGFVTFASIPSTEKITTEISQTNMVREQIIIDAVINPVIEGRINF